MELRITGHCHCRANLWNVFAHNWSWWILCSK